MALIAFIAIFAGAGVWRALSMSGLDSWFAMLVGALAAAALIWYLNGLVAL